MKNVRIKIENRSLLAHRDENIEGRLSDGGFDKVLRRLLIEEVDTAKYVGCIVFYLGILAAYSWDSQENTEYGKEDRLELALANLLPHLNLGLDHITATFGHSASCVLCYFDKDGGGYKDEVIYRIKLQDGFFKTAQKIVFPNGLSKKSIKQELLQILLNSLEENPGTYMLFEDLQASIPLTTKDLIFNLNLLHEDELIDLMMAPHSDPPKIVSVKVKSKGIRELDGETETAVQSAPVVKNIYGTNIENLTTQGDNSPINITIGDVNTAFGDIIKTINEQEFEGKEEVLNQVQELKAELSGDAEPNKVKTLMSGIKSKAAWVYNLIFKNPVLTAYLTQLLLQTL